jgi:hypothetical protein
MMAVISPDLKLGFWVGLGVLVALAVWGLLTGLAGRAVGKVGG